MSIITVFKNYIEEHHPHLTEKEWRVDVQTVLMGDKKTNGIKTIISIKKAQELTYLIFSHDGDVSNIVYVLQDKQDSRNIGISLLRNGVLVNPISIYEGAADWYREQLNLIINQRGSL